MLRTAWPDLPAEVRAAVVEWTGPVTTARTVADGLNSAVAVVLDTPTGAVFVKGLHDEHPGVVTQRREAAINRYVRTVSPALLWQVHVSGWDLLGFEYLNGRHADYAPGSPDLPDVVAAVRRIGELPCPELPEIKQAVDRWAGHLDGSADAALLDGNTLLHTDYNPLNVLLAPDHPARVIDWAWPTRGAAFIDPACLALRLIAAGHRPVDAESLIRDLPAWQAASAPAVTLFADAAARMWAEIAHADPQPWKRQMATAAHQWRDHRTG